MHNMMNSNLVIQYWFMDQVQVVAHLQGPTEAKFASKQDPSRAFIEVNIKGASAVQGQISSQKRDIKKLKYDVKAVLEQII